MAVPAPPQEPVHRVILVDHSLSMSVTSDGSSRLNRAKEALRGLLSGQRPGDTATLVSLVEPGRPLTDQPLIGRPSALSVRDVLNSVVPREGAIRLPTALASAVAALAGTPEAAAEMYVLSDFPREAVPDLPRLEWFQIGAKARSIRVTCVNMAGPGEEGRGNVAILGATFGTDLAVSGVPLTFYVDAANTLNAETAARILVAGERNLSEEKVVVLQPNERIRVPLGITFTSPGVESLRITAEPGLLKAASETHLSVEVRERLVVWLLADEPDPTQRDALGEPEFVRRALAESDGQAPSVELAEVELIDIARPIPDSVDVVVLAGPRVITPTVREPLTRFVRRGGGLVIALSPAADISFYNPNLDGLLPAALVQPARATVSPESFSMVKTQTADTLPPLFAEFSDDRGGQLNAARMYNYMLVEGAASPDAALFRLEGRDPLLLHRALGRGHVLLFTSSLGISWNSLPVCRAFLPFLHRLLNSAAQSRSLPRNILPGQPFVATWPAVEDVTVTWPDSQETRTKSMASPAGNFVVVESPAQRGLYRLKGEPSGHSETFTVVGACPEADLRTLDVEQKRLLETLLGTTLHPDWPSAVKALGPADESIRLWHWLLLAVLGIYLLETWFVRLL
jgi:hypothetical protein